MDFLILILLAVFSFMISIAVHELGHVLMGIKKGFKFYLFIFGPFGFKRNENDRIIFYIEKDISLWGGVGATIPINNNYDNYKKFGHVILGGPFASLTFGAICLLLSTITDIKFFLLLGIMSLSIGLVSLIPMRNGAFYTDGGRWMRMHKNQKTKAIEMAIWNLTQNSIIQGDFQKANFEEIMILINDEDIRTKYLGHFYAYNYYKDNKNILDMVKEKIELEKLKAKVPKQMASIYKVD